MLDLRKYLKCCGVLFKGSLMTIFWGVESKTNRGFDEKSDQQNVKNLIGGRGRPINKFCWEKLPVNGRWYKRDTNQKIRKRNETSEPAIGNMYYNAWFTFSWRQHKTWWDRECDGYIYLVFHTLDLFSARLKAIEIQ